MEGEAIMCEYCQYDENGDTQNIADTELTKWKYGLLDVGCFIDGNDLYISVHTDKNGDCNIESAFIPKIKINYCPMCGRELESIKVATEQ